MDNAGSIEAPVLLVHGDLDPRFRREQARDMHAALEKSDKTVTYIELENYSAWLLRNEPRKRVAGELSDFVSRYLPVRD